MIEIGNNKIFFGDFHGQWNASEEELALLVAGLSYHGYDFSAFQSPDRFDSLNKIISENNLPLRLFPGKEYMYDWAHLTTVNVKGEAPPINDPDCEKVLAWFKKNGDWVIIAHPYHFMIDRLEALLDSNLIDAVELINGHLNSNRNTGLINWYETMLRKGKGVPIVSGLDIHIPTGSRRPGVLYSASYPASADIVLFGANRTGVIMDSCNIYNAKAAIAGRKTFIELSSERKLIGPPEIIEYLERNHYWEIVDQDLAQRRKLQLQSTGMIIGGQSNELTCHELADSVSIAGTNCKTTSCGKVIANVPLLFNRNTQYLNIISRSQNTCTVNALKVYHPIHIEIFPDINGKRCTTVTKISNIGRETIDGLRLYISCAGHEISELVQLITPLATEQFIHEWDIADTSRPIKFDIHADNEHFHKEFSKYLVFIECPYIENPEEDGQWEKICSVKLSGNFSEQVDTNFTVEWNGDDDLSGAIKIAWNQGGLYFKMSITDDILVPSQTALLMFGDSFQIGVNPVGTEEVGNQSFYDIMMTRGAEPDGIEKAYMERPVNMALEYPQDQRMLLDGLYHGKIINGKFNALLTLPFHLISPMQPVPGYRFGLYYVIFDNDGTGLKTVLQWPLHAERFAGQAWYVPNGGAWACVKLTK